MRPTVLVLDDEPEITILIERDLEEDGYNVLVAHSEAEFRDLIREHPIDIFLLDLNLPDSSGLTLLKEIRRVSDVAIVILTGRTDSTDEIVGLEIGADDYITKPFRPRELRARLNSVYRRTKGKRYLPSDSGPPAAGAEATASGGGQAREGDILFDGYALSPGRRQIFGPDGQEIDLTVAEFDLLHALVSRRGQVLTRDQIMNAIKGRNWESYDRAVDSMISRLRKKIPAPEGQSHYIRTVYGVGYTFRG
ncbi:response regulator transcription factor [Alkalilacustris brevis]|uniref:response regulator transcription factor n=1 Tax=Alkalilacustris brevis TaxID=2026338 RepID=UPI000E0DB184|nr:response regulator transcription factor [Alkalilacustris brevis]